MASPILEHAFVGVAMFVLDFFWARYVVEVSRHAPMRAALWSTCIALTSSAVTIVYVSNRWTILAGAIGAFFGTWISVKRYA
jgi:hypothetical protein